MKSRAPRIAALALPLALVLLAAASNADAQVTGRLTGSAVDEAGNPLEGVEIYLKNTETNAVLRPAKTGKKGTFLYVTEPGAYLLSAKMEGMWVAQLKISITGGDGKEQVAVHFFDDTQTFDKTVRLLPTGDIASKVKCRADFVLTTPDKHTEVVNRLYAEYKGTPVEEGGAGGATGVPAAPVQKSPYEQAVELLALKDYAGAIPLLKTSLETKPDDVEAQYQLGKACLEIKNYPEAEAAFKAAKQLDPTKQGVSFHLARLYNEKSRKVQAMQALEEERALSPDSEAVLDSLAGLYMDVGQPDKAVATYEDLIQRNPEHLDAYISLAGLYKELGDRAKEEETYKRLGAKDPTGTSLYNLGNLAFNRDERDKAALYYQQVLEKNPSHAMAHFQLGNTLVGLGDLAEAVPHFEAFLKLAPKDPKAAEAKATMEALKKMLPGGR